MKEDGRTHKSVACSRVTLGTEVYQMVQVLIVPSLYGSPSRRLGCCLQRAFGNWSIPSRFRRAFKWLSIYNIWGLVFQC